MAFLLEYKSLAKFQKGLNRVMLTPQEISDKVFVKAVFGGYDMTGVDTFLESISADYAALYKENAILKGKLKVLVEKVEEYRSTEDAMRMALLTAQRMGEDMLSKATQKSEETIKSAESEAASKLSDVENQIAQEELKLAAAAKETAKFLEATQIMLAKHSEFLTKLEKARLVHVKEDPPPPPPVEKQPEQSREEQLENAANQIITGALESLKKEQEVDAENESAEGDGNKDESDTKVYSIKDIQVAEETNRPKFDFDDLKFGSNFQNDD